MAWQEPKLMINMRVTLGCFINVVQLYHCSCMTMLSVLYAQAFPQRLPLGMAHQPGTCCQRISMVIS